MIIDFPILDCPCGKVHGKTIELIVIEKGLINRLSEHIKSLPVGNRAFVFADQNTLKVAGKAVPAQLEAAGKEVNTLVFKRDADLVPDEFAIGEALLGLEPKPDFLVSVGSGTITDITRFVASLCKVPFVVVATAPSMDGYASGVSPLITHGAKQTFIADSPLAIFADLDILADCPAHMIQAGIGDLLGKITSKADWLLSHQLNGEYYCPESQKLVDEAVQLSIDNMGRADGRSHAFIHELMRGLILSGIAMAMVGNSRPASGAEHHLAHYWENHCLKKSAEHYLHGQYVGYATLLILKVYEKALTRVKASCDPELVNAFLPIEKVLISNNEYRGLLQTAGAVSTYQELALSRELVLSGLLEAKNIRDRYTILRFAEAQGWLPEIASEIMQEI